MFYRNSWPRRSTKGRLLLATGLTLLCTFLLFIPLASARSARVPSDAPKITVKAGFGGQYRNNSWIPVQITLVNNGSEFDGKISIDPPTQTINYGGPPAPASTTTYQQTISLPPMSHKQITLYIPISLTGPQANETITANLIDNNGHKVGSGSDMVNNVSQSDVSIALVSNNPNLNHGQMGAALDSLNSSSSRVAPPQLLTATDLPPIVQPLKNFDLIVLDNFDTGSLSKDQVQALQNWVSQGGTLVAVGGPEWHATLNALPADLLPITVTGTDTVPPGTQLLPTGAPGSSQGDSLDTSVKVSVGMARANSSTLLSAGNIPLIVQANQGQGLVYYLAYDPFLDPLANWTSTSSLWGTLIFRSVGDQVLTANNSNFNSPYGTYSSLQSFIQMLIPNALPPTWLILILLFSYILILGPLRLILIRVLKKRSWSWRIILSTIVVFTTLTYGLAYLQKGSSVISSGLSVVQLNRPDATGSSEHVTNYMGVFVPNQGDFHVHIPGSDLVQPDQQSYSPYYTMGMNGTGQSGKQQTTITSLADGTDVDLQGVDIWTLRTLLSQHDGHTAGGITADLTYTQTQVTGTVTNSLPYALGDVYLLVGNDFASVGSLAAGMTKQVSFQLTASTGSQAGTQQQSLTDQIANLHNMPSNQFNPYGTTLSDQDEAHRHVAMLQALSGCNMGGGGCYQKGMYYPGMNVGSSTTRAILGGPYRASTLDSLLLPGASATLIGWSTTPTAGSDAITINGGVPQNTQETLVQAPLDLKFSGAITLPDNLVSAQIVNIQGTSSAAIQQVMPGSYCMATGTMTFELTLPTMPRLHGSSFTLTEPNNQLNKGMGMGVPNMCNTASNTSDVNHMHVSLYNWQTHAWDDHAFSNFTLKVDTAQDYVGAAGRVLLRFSNQDNALGKISFNMPALALNGTVE